MLLPWSKPRPAPPQPPQDGSAEARLLRAAFDADVAMAALAAALSDRRRAMVALLAATPMCGARSLISIQFSPSFTWRAAGWFGMAAHMDLPVQRPQHCQSFTHFARSCIESTAFARRQAEIVRQAALSPDPAPADPGDFMEAPDVETV